MFGVEYVTPLESFVNANLSPKQTNLSPMQTNLSQGQPKTDLRHVVEELMNSTPPEDRVDSDGDGLYDKVEVAIGTDPHNPDSDFDGLNDSYEIHLGLDPLNPDSNHDGLPDYYEVTNVKSLDVNGNGVPNAWDPDNDGDGVNDAVDLSPFATSNMSNSFHFSINTNGLPLYITFQVRPQNPDYLKLINKYWDWPPDDKGSMKDLDNSKDDLHLIPMLNLTANIIPNQSKVIDYGIITTSSSAYVPLFPVDEYGTTVAFTGKMFYPLGPPLNLSLDARMVWKVVGKSDEKAVALKAYNGKYISVDNQSRAVASRNEISDEDKLQIVDLGQNKVAYKAPNGLYLSVAGNGLVFANATVVGDRESFELVKVIGNTFALKTYNGLYLATRTDGVLAATPTLIPTMLFLNPTMLFLSIDAGVISQIITLVTYTEPFMITGLTVEENYGSQIGLFFSNNRDETVAANLLLSYDFLRNSTTTLSDMPSILSSRGSQVFSQTSSFSHKDEAFMALTNKAIPNVLNMLRAGAGSQILPVINLIEDHFASLDLSQMVPTPYMTGASWSANLTAEPVVVSKTLKMNLYNTTTCESLQLADVMTEVNHWTTNENASIELMSMMAAWNIGEQLITKVGQNETKFDFFADYLKIFGSVKDYGFGAFEALRRTVLRGYEAYRLISEANALWLKSGGKIGGKTFSSMCSAWWTNFKNIGNSKTGRLLAFKRISVTLDVVGGIVDLGIAIYSLFSILGAGLNPMQLYAALMHTVMTLAYSMTLAMIAAIPVIGWIISLLITISDTIFGWSEKLFNLIISAMCKVTAQVIPSISLVGEPNITIIDKDDNGIDVGDRIQFTARIKATLASWDTEVLGDSSMYPYYLIEGPAGTNSTVGYPYLTDWVFMARDLGLNGWYDVHLLLPIPPPENRTYTSGAGWDAHEYEVGGWIEPGTAMPNFPVTIESKTTYDLWYKFKIFFFIIFWWHWYEFLGWKAGIQNLGSQTLYFDVLPSKLSDFLNWKSITPLDRDFDGLRDTEENASNPLLYDTDGDGLNDKYELQIGTNPKLPDSDHDGLPDKLELIYGTDPNNPDTDGDGLSDGQEIAGWISVFNYGGKLITLHVTSNPLVSDTDHDGLPDNLEYSSRQNPRSKDTDGDGIIDQDRAPIPLPDSLVDSDGDGLSDAVEKAGWNIVISNSSGTFTVHVTSDPYLNDTDFDGLADWQEYNMSTNPRVPDTDGDGLPDLVEIKSGTNPVSFDTDGDGVSDGIELTFGCNPKKSDTDGDGLPDLKEILLGTDPTKNDTDSDGLSDFQEVQFGSNPTVPDSDGDLLFDGQEFKLHTNPVCNDSDHDGLPDGFEVMIGTNPLSNDTDGDGVPDYKELELGINPVCNDTDFDGLSDGVELRLGTAPWNNDTDFDGLNDLMDPDTYIPNVKQVVFASDDNSNTTGLVSNLGLYTNVTVVSAKELLANYSNAPYIVLVGKPSSENGTVGNIIRSLLQDYGEHLTNETLDNRLAVRYGVWSSKQTVVILSEPYFADYFRVLSILKSKNVTILPDSIIVNYPSFIGPIANLGYFPYFITDEMDMVRATDSVVGVGLQQSANPSIQVTKYNATTTPHSLTQQNGLSKGESAIGKYLEVKISENVQNSTSNKISGALIQIYYTAADLDRTGDGDANDPQDFDENTLMLYYFNESSGRWAKLTTNLSWVKEVGVNTTDVEVYGKKYAGYVWAYVSRFAFYGLAGRVLFNHPPDVSGAYPSKECLWPPDHKFVNVTIEGVTDPDGDPVTIRILNITSDEPTVSTPWLCGHHKFHYHHHCHCHHNCTVYDAPDAYGIGTDTAHLRAERLGNGNGRVYVITFLASDGRGGETVGSVKVYVPHDRSDGTWNCIDDGQLYDATQINWAEPPCYQWRCGCN
jgi:hypothetical protein